MIPSANTFGLLGIIMIGAIWIAANRSNAQDVLTVRADGSGDFATIQEAIDAAPENGLIRIGPGTFSGGVVVTKPIRIEGAGWDQTRLTSRWFRFDHDLSFLPDERRAAIEQGLERIKNASGGDEQMAILKEVFEKYGPKSCLTVRNTSGVVVSQLRMSCPGVINQGGFGGAPAVLLENCRAEIVDCAVVDSAIEGFHIKKSAKVTIRNCLVGGIRGSGIQVDFGKEGSADIVDCDIRNCGYSGVMLREGSDATTIKGCRISAMRFHGIRYDGASPTIVDCLIFDNRRAGIYADDTTSATIRNSVFVGNGIWAGGNCGDTIERNTFVGGSINQYRHGGGGVECWSVEDMVVRGNIFFDNENGISFSAGDNTDDESFPEVTIENNLFWNNRRDVARLISTETERRHESLELPTHNEKADPEFVDADKRDFQTEPTSPARTNQIGATPSIEFSSPWPTQAEESAMMQQID